MKYSGIARICISVENLDRSCAFYCNNIGFFEVASGTLDSAQVKALYGIEGSDAAYRMLKNKEQETLLQLIQFSKRSGIFIRDGHTTWDYGYFDIAVRSKDNFQACQDFVSQGYQYLSTPTHYAADWINMDVSEGVLIGPDRLPIAMIQRLKEPVPKFDGAFSSLTDVAQIVCDMDEARRFYGGVLGLNKIFDSMMGCILSTVRNCLWTQRRITP